MKNKLASFWLIGVILLLAQIFLFRDFAIWDRAFLFLYIYLILKLPLNFGIFWTLTLAFIVGWVVDLFLLSYGLHAFSAVLLAFIKYPLLRIIGFDNNNEEDLSINLSTLKIQKIVPYFFIATFIYSFSYFILEASDRSIFGIVLLKTIFTSIITSIIFILVEFFSTSK